MNPLLLGMQWGGERGGLDRYFTEVSTNLASSLDLSAVVLGPAESAPSFVVIGARADDVLPVRLLRYSLAVHRASAGSGLMVPHFALLAWGPLHLDRRVRRLPCVVHFHGPWADESGASGATALAQRIKRSVERSVYRRADQLILDSSAFRDLLVDRYDVAAAKISVVFPGVDLARFSPGPSSGHRSSLGLSDSAFVAFTVRRLVPRMGLDVLIRAWGDVRDDAHLVIAGDGPERAPLADLAEAVGVSERVHLLGKISDSDLAGWYRSADISVVPSTKLEGFGLVVLESLACGTPVISTNAGGLPEIVGKLDPSLVVPAANAAALATRINQAISDPASVPDRGALSSLRRAAFLGGNHGAVRRDLLQSRSAPARRLHQPLRHDVGRGDIAAPNSA